MPAGTKSCTLYTSSAPETSASRKVASDSEQRDVMFCTVCDDGGRTPSTLRAVQHFVMPWPPRDIPLPALFCSVAAKQDHSMGLSLPQQQALYYYSHAWLTPDLPAVRKHHKSQLGAVFFTADLRPAVPSPSIKQCTEGKHAWHYNDNISQIICPKWRPLSSHSRYQSFAARHTLILIPSFLFLIHVKVTFTKRSLFFDGHATDLLQYSLCGRSVWMMCSARLQCSAALNTMLS